MLKLLIRADDGSERPMDVREGMVRIGRSPDNDIVLPDANKGVSRAHAELRFESGRWFIFDLNSQNGTWLNGHRVQRAEVPVDAEITVGLYRLLVQSSDAFTSIDPRGPAPRPAPPAAVVSARPSPPKPPAAQPSPVAPTVPVPVIASTRAAADLPLRNAAAKAPVADTGMTPPIRRQATLTTAVIAAASVAAVGAGLWFAAPFGHRSPPAPAPAAAPASSAPASPSGAPPAPGDTTATTPAAAPAAPVAPPLESTTSSGLSPARSKSGAASAQTAAAAAAGGARATAPDAAVARKPGESVQAWRERASALQARYAYSKVALDRGDYAAAAGGFAAILLEEPGFLDAPQLLVKARDGLRAAAHDAMDAGNRLDAAGDWLSALRKYDQAREIDAATPGLDGAVKRVREKMRVAGNDALKRAREYDALGRPLDALKEYEKAAQWLPADDANREVARSRADQLKAGIK